ncbi:MAG: hypothetical protein ACP5VP_09430 [Candidatus Limnocylindrales bacterium]
MERATLIQNGGAHDAPSGRMPAAARGCESERGTWGELCPDCGVRLPPRPALLQSWHGARTNDPLRSERARSLNSPLRHWRLR